MILFIIDLITVIYFIKLCDKYLSVACRSDSGYKWCYRQTAVRRFDVINSYLNRCLTS